MKKILLTIGLGFSLCFGAKAGTASVDSASRRLQMIHLGRLSSRLGAPSCFPATTQTYIPQG